MNTRKLNIFAALLGLMLAFAACQPEEFSLGKIISKEDLQYSITQNAEDPNMIILESLTPGATPLWVTPMGRSTRVKDTVLIPFEGEYEFTYGVMSAGGFVKDDVYKLSVTTTNLNYVDDPLWTLLTGGVGEEKTWILDLDADGVSKYFAGPLYFYGTDDSWATVTDGETLPEGSDSWNWKPDWAGNSWLMPAGDYGTMTFDLKGGAHVTVDHKMLGRVETGTYFLDADAKTLKMTDAGPLHDEGRDGQVIDWGDLKVMSLTENTLQLAALRDEALSGEGPTLLTYNFISKEYADNWVPEDLPDPEPPYNGNANEDLTTAVSTTKIWKIDMDIPYNWHGLDGSVLNEVASTTSDGGFAFTTWTPPYDGAAFGAVTMELTKENGDGGTYVIETLTDFYEGSYTVDENNNIDFGQPITFFSGVGGWLTFGTTAENTLRIIISERDASGNVEGIWLGQRSADKAEYMSLHMTPVAGGGEVDPMQVWQNALKGKTLVPDVNYFADWYAADWSGGWSADVFPDDFTSQSWFWSEEVYNASLASSISFYMDGDVLKADAIDNGTEKTGITVDIDPDNGTLTFSEAPLSYSWIFTNNNDGVGPWMVGSHDGASLSNISEKGLYLGFYSKYDETDPEVPTEITAFHMVLGN